MPRMKRKILPGRSYHITHRCYNREFRFQRAIERNNYRMRLFEMSRKYNVKVLDYMITSNHVHLLFWTGRLYGSTSNWSYIVYSECWCRL